MTLPLFFREEEHLAAKDMNEILYTKISEAEMTTRAIHGIERFMQGRFGVPIRCVGDLCKVKESELLSTPGLGRKTINEIKNYLSCNRLSLKEAK